MPTLDQYNTSLGQWIGTPYEHGARRIGVGADCLTIGKVMAELFDLDLEIPVYPRKPSMSHGRRLQRTLDELLVYEDVILFEPGRLLLFSIRGIPCHLGAIRCSERGYPTIVHTIYPHGVVEHGIEGSWARRIVRSYPLPFEESL